MSNLNNAFAFGAAPTSISTFSFTSTRPTVATAKSKATSTTTSFHFPSFHNKPNDEDDVGDAFTCSICLDFYNTPKNLPNCGHCYCLPCLSSLYYPTAGKIATQAKNTISCPDCRVVSNVGPEGVAGLRTNIQLQRGAELWKKKRAEMEAAPKAVTASDSNSSSDQCPHQTYLSSKNSATCAHCDRKFCDRCQFVHCEKIKIEILQRGKDLAQRADVALNGSEDLFQITKFEIAENVRRIESLISQAAQSLQVAIKVCIDEQVEKVTNDAKAVGEAQFKRILETTRNVQDKSGADLEMKRKIAELESKSVLQLSLHEVSNLHKQVVQRIAEVEALEKLKNTFNCSIDFKSEPQLLNSVVTQFKFFKIGALHEN